VTVSGDHSPIPSERSSSTPQALAAFTSTNPGAGETFQVMLDVIGDHEADFQGFPPPDDGEFSDEFSFGNIHGTVTVEYLVADIPEPASIALLLLGVCPAVLLRRRRPRTRS
jgi:hypothetical protein